MKKRGKLLALALAVSTAFTMLAPSTGLMEAGTVRAEKTEDFYTVTSKDGVTTGGSVIIDADTESDTLTVAVTSAGATKINADATSGTEITVTAIVKSDGNFAKLENSTGETEKNYTIKLGDNLDGKVDIKVWFGQNIGAQRNATVSLMLSNLDHFNLQYIQTEKSNSSSDVATTEAYIKDVEIVAEGDAKSVSVDSSLNLTAKPIFGNESDEDGVKKLTERFNSAIKYAKWVSSDEKIAKVSDDDKDGVATLTGVAVGKVTISVSYNDHEVEKDFEVTAKKSSSGGSNGGGSTNSKTVKNADGSTTTTTTTAKGTITTTTKTNADGSKSTKKVVANKDGSGSVTETTVSAKGTTKSVEVVTDTTGAVAEVSTSVSNAKGVSMSASYKANGTKLTLSKIETEGKTAVTIPATVKCDGKTYKVTKIGTGAMSGNKEIKTVTLGKNITVIGKNAFKGASKLKTINLKKAPTKVGKNAFKGIKKNAVIKIKATKKAFKAAKKLIKKSGIASTVKIKRVK